MIYLARFHNLHLAKWQKIPPAWLPLLRDLNTLTVSWQTASSVDIPFLTQNCSWTKLKVHIRIVICKPDYQLGYM
jgi:hypothetical protein